METDKKDNPDDPIKGPGPAQNKSVNPKAQKVEPVKAQKVEKEEGPDPNGDMGTVDAKYAEPKGTRHTDQFNTAFPEEKNTVRP